MNLRLFIAIELPDAVRDGLAAVQTGLQRSLPRGAVRWTDPSRIHLTLKFLGDVDAAALPAVAQAMDAAARSFAPFELQVGGVGCFPTPRQPRIVWAGIPAPPKALSGVAHALELHLERLNFAREARPFSPHLTIGRVNDRLDAAQRQALAAALAQPAVGHIGAVAVQEIVLFHSDLKPGGPVYTAQARSPLNVG